MTKETLEINGNKIDLARINNDVNGNPRYVIHFLHIADNFLDAKNIIREIGGKAYRGKDFGGGLVFSSYNVLSDLKQIIK